MISKRTSLVVSMVALLACEAPTPLDTTRKIPPRGTLGEEMFRLFHRDFERETPRRALGFMLERDGFVAAIDHAFPEDELSRVQDFLVRLLPLYDDSTIPNLNRRFAAVAGRLAEDDDAIRALAAISNRLGYIDLAHQEALALRLSRCPRFRELANRKLDLTLAHDGLDAGGKSDPNESDILSTLTAVIADRMAKLSVDTDDEQTIEALADLLLSEDQRLDTGIDGPLMVARDDRGLAKVVTANGAVPSPFVDRAPADGLADIDESGRFLSVSGEPIVLPPFGAKGARDSMERPMTTGPDALVYDYVELDRTVLAGVARDTRKLIDDGIPMKSVRTLEAFLGERGEDGLYSTENNALLELTHALAVTLDGNELPELLDLARILVDEHEPIIAHVMLELKRQSDITDRYDVNLRTGATLFDDLMSVIRKILREPGLAEALLDAVQNDPALLGFPAASATLCATKHPLVTKADLVAGRVFDTPVDRARPDVGQNQSLHQRLLHLIFDTKGVRYEPKFAGVPIGFVFEIKDLAEFYLLSTIGASEVPSLVSQLTGMSARPTALELAEFINADQAFGNPKGHEGFEVKDNDGDTLFAASAGGMTDALAPLVRAFHENGQLDLLFELFQVLHLHWASTESDYQDRGRGEPRYSKLSGIRHYEPLLIDVYRNAHVLEAVRDLLVDLDRVRTKSGRTFRDVLLATARRVIAKDSALTTRSGARQVVIDGKRVSPLSPFDLVRSALDGVDQVVGRRASTKREWDEVTDALHEMFAKVEASGPKAGRFTNSRTAPILAAVLAFLEDEVRTHPNDRSAWLRNDFTGAVVDLFESKELPALFDLVHLVDDDEALSDLLGELRDELLDEDRGFPDLLVVTGDLLAASKDAKLAVAYSRFFGREIHPDKQLIFHAATTTKKLLAADGEDRLIETLRRSMERSPHGGLYMDGLSRSIRQTNRLNPLYEGPLTAEDVRLVVEKVHSYMLDGEHGLERVYKCIANRK